MRLLTFAGKPIATLLNYSGLRWWSEFPWIKGCSLQQSTMPSDEKQYAKNKLWEIRDKPIFRWFQDKK